MSYSFHSKENNTHLNQIIKTQAKLAEADFNFDAFMQLVVEQMQSLTPATGVVVELVEGDEMVYRAAIGTVVDYVGFRLKIQNSISGLCVLNNEVLRSDDTEKDSRVNVEACRKVGARSLVVAPLIYEGNPVGVLKILSINANSFLEKDVQTLQLMAGFIAAGVAHQLFYEKNAKLLKERTEALIELHNAKDKLEYLAHHDPLTNLVNRRFFQDKLITAMKKVKKMQSLLALMYLDIDHFKHINDSLGHDTGDELLKTFSSRLKECVYDKNIIARLGGDEFVILLEEVSNANEAILLAKNIIRKINEKIQLNHNNLNITTSIGITFYRGDTIAPDELIKQADDALYLSKKAGRNTFSIFEN